MYLEYLEPIHVQSDPSHPQFRAGFVRGDLLGYEPQQAPPPGHAVYLSEFHAGSVWLNPDAAQDYIIHKTIRMAQKIAAMRTAAIAAGEPDPAADAIAMYHMAVASGLDDATVDGARAVALIRGATAEEVA